MSVVLDEQSRLFLDRSQDAASSARKEIEAQRQRELEQQRALAEQQRVLAEEQRQRAEEAETAAKRQKRLTRIALGVSGSWL